MSTQTAPAAPPVRLAAKLGFSSIEEFCVKYASSVSRGGIYLRVKEPRPLGTLVDLELRLATGDLLLRAQGVVSYTTGTQGTGLPGMGIRFLSLDAPSAQVVERACLGRPAAEVSLPPLPPGVGPALGEYAGAMVRPAPVQPVPPPQPVPQPVAEAHPPLPTPAPPPPSPAPRVAAPAVTAAPVVAQQRPAEPPRVPPAIGAEPQAQIVIETPLDRVKKPSEKPAGPIIGIDLGTTYSCAAYVKNGKPYVIPSREGHNTVPSIIALNTRNRLVIGHPAKGQMLTNPRQTVYGAKRLVGRPFASETVKQIKDRFHYEIVEGQNGESSVKLGPRVFSLQELSAMILCEVKELAQNHLATPVERAVITCPAYYNDLQRQAVREAGALAGLHVERILNEPTAAALAFGYGRDLEQRILIYDLGGGTFDASLLELHGNIYEVISTGGDTFLGGVDFDMQLVDHLLMEFQKKTGTAFQGDRVALQRLVDAAERAKIALSESESTQVRVPFLTIIDGKPMDLDVTVTRAQFTDLTRSLIERTIQVCDDVLKTKGLTPKDVQEVILVGGMSRMPLVKQLVEQYFGRAPHKGVHPDEAVALGAALLGFSLEQLQGVVLIDVLPMSIGIGLPGGRFKSVLPRNTPLPHTRSYGVSTTRDGQTSLEVSIFQGDSERSDENEFLGTLKLEKLPSRPRGEVKISVTFVVSAEGLLTVTGKDLATGKEVSTTFNTRERPQGPQKDAAAPQEEDRDAPLPPPKAPPAHSQKSSGGVWGMFKKLFGR